MAQRDKVVFGIQVAPTSGAPAPDHELYAGVIEDCELGAELGYDAAWFLEHHFSDYYPTPSPLVFMAHIAAHCPDLGLGTSVLVLPWYHPLRLAEEIAMVNALTRGTLHLGLGRGTAKSEYDAYGVDMREARGRFGEIWRIVETALSGEPFTFDGKFYKVPREIRVRPLPTGKKVQFYGAIGSPGSATIMADLGLPPLCLAQFPDGLLAKVIERWRGRTRELGGNAGARSALSIKCFIGDSDEDARRLARKYLPINFEVQARHYEVDADPWKGIADYEVFSRMFANMKAMTNPDNLGPMMDMNLVGSADTVAQRIDVLRDIGFDYFVISAATPGVPASVRRDVYRRFAAEVMPRYARATSGMAAVGED